MKVICAILLVVVLAIDSILSKECPNKKLNSKLICYYSKLDLKQITNCKCSHIVLAANTGLETINELRDVVQKSVKLLITIDDFNQDVVDLLNSHQLDGIELNLKKLKSRDDINDFLSTIRQKFNNLSTLLAIPTKPELLAKHYDFKTLTKYVDGFVLETAFVGMSKNVTFHPSRLSGLWDIQNTDSVVDLVSGLGAPLSKLIITAPVQGFQFKLQNSKHTAPGSPAVEIQTISRDELCKSMRNGQNWTLERDQDQAGPFIFSDDQWIAFDDATSIDIKAKYSRIRGLAGLALKDLSQDGGGACGTTLLDAAFDGLNRQARAPRGAVLHSLEREIREIPHTLDTIQVSPYRITRVIDVDGNIHAIRQDTRTEFACSRQGYFVHPRSCNRFYRCVKFDQLTDEFNVFEFNCPAGLVFDERVEVCVWPGNLEHGSPCAGSSEIAPVPQQRFACPSEPGYYADPENCRWFFACLDHGKSAPSAYEFRCPFGLVFDESRLLCEWAWLVPRCASGYTTGSAVVYGHSGVVPLEQYDGLGVLPATKLGGLTGPLQQPVAQIYTNVGSGGIIANTDSSGYKIINAGFGGLSANAALSLQNAGLLNIGQYNTFGRQGVNYQDAGKSQQYVTTGDVGSIYQNNGALLQNAHQNDGTYLTGLEGSAVLTTDQQNAHLINNLAHDTSAQIVGNAEFGAKSHQNIEQYHQHANNEAVLNQNNLKLISTSSHGSGIAGNINIVGGGYSAVSSFDRGIEISNNGVGSSTIAHVTPSPISITTLPSVPTVTTVPIPSISTATSFQSYKGGVVANLPQLQYRLDSHDLQLQSGHSSSGFSTSQQNVNVANISRNYVNLISSTPDYGSVGIVSTPASVLQREQLLQIPARATASYSYENQGLIGDYGYNKAAAFDGASSKTGYNGAKSLTFIQTQPAIQPVLSVSNFHNYYAGSDTNAATAAKKTTLQSESKLLQPAVSVSTFEGYLYDRPSVKFEEKPLLRVQPVQTQQPAISVTTFQQPSIVAQPTSQTVTQQPDVKIQSIVQPTVAIPLQPTIQAVIKQPSAVSVSSFQGYHYQKPSVQYEQVKVQPPLSVSTFQGYNYQKPTVQFEARPLIKVQPSVQPTVQTVVQPAVSFQTYQSYGNNKASAAAEESLGTVVEQYNYQKPAEQFEERPLTNVQPSVQPAVSYQTYQSYGNNKASAAAEESLGTVVKQYNYQKPAEQFEERPLTNVQPSVQPAVSYQTFQSYGNEKGSTAAEGQTFEKVEALGSVVEQQPTVSVSTFQGYNYQRPSVQFEERPLIKMQPSVQPTIQPAVSLQTFQSYSSNKASAVAAQKANEKVEFTVIEQQPTVSVSKFDGYNYQKPSVQFEERPLIRVQPSIQPSVQTVAQPAVSFQTYQSYSNNKASAAAEKNAFESLKTVVGQQSSVPVIQPATSFQTFESYGNQQTANVDAGKTFANTESLETVVQQQPAVSTFQGYHYQRPTLQFEERPLIKVQPTVQVPVIKQPALSVASFETYSQPKSTVLFEEKPQVKIETPNVKTISQPAVSFSTFQSYNDQESVVPLQPIVQNVIKQQPVVHETTFQGYNYRRPSVVFEEKPQIYASSTPAPIVSSTPAIVTSFSISSQAQQNQDDHEKSSVILKSVQPIVQKTILPAPSSAYNLQKVIEDYTYSEQQTPAVIGYTVSTAKPAVVSSYSYTAPGYNYRQPASTGYIYERPQIRFEEEPLPVSEVPFVKKTAYVTGNLDENSAYISGEQNQEVNSKFVENYQISSTPRPIIDYTYVQTSPRPTFGSTVLTAAKIPVTPKQFYYYDSRLSSTPRPELEYATPATLLPTITVVPSTTSRPIAKYSFSSLDETPIISQYQPIRQRVKITTPVPTQAITVPELSREYLPVATSVKVTTPAQEYLPVAIHSTTAAPITEDEVVISTRRPAKVVKIVRPKTIIKQNDFNPLLTTKLGAQCTCISNTLRLRKKPLKIIVETVDDDADDGYVVDSNNDGQIIENYQYESQRTVDVTPVTGKTRVTDGEIVKAVRTGFNLVKEAVKDGTNEALNSKSFDRYGPGGVRSRNERLQGTIDCQRAGLFRHPTECNKFYACRWDCTKNRYTLHVFNCPVHLTFDNSLGACNWPSQGPACLENTLLPSD